MWKGEGNGNRKFSLNNEGGDVQGCTGFPNVNNIQNSKI